MQRGIDADSAGLTSPTFTYGRYAGFIYADYCNCRVFLLENDEREGWKTRIVVSMLKGSILSFGMDADGTVYVLTRRNPIMRMQLDVEK